jgi:hypothetical protein
MTTVLDHDDVARGDEGSTPGNGALTAITATAFRNDRRDASGGFESSSSAMMERVLPAPGRSGD